MKTSVTITLFIFWMVVTAVLAAALITRSNCPTTASNSPTDSTGITSAGNMAGVILNARTIAAHNNSNDCWMIIDKKVYDLTAAINSHPGGVGMIIKYCGIDGSQSFITKDREPGKSHSGFANELLVNYLLGNLNQNLSGPQFQDAKKSIDVNSQNASAQLKERDENDDD